METNNTNQQPQLNPSPPQIQPSLNPSPNQRGNFLIPIGLAFLILVIGVGAYYLGTKSTISYKPDVTQTIPSPTVTEESATNIPFPTNTTTSIPTTKPISYVAPSSWKKTQMMNNALTLCLPPKWESDHRGTVYFNRDPGYRPNVTYIQEIPYSSGSRRDAYFKFWESEYPNVRELVSIKETNIGNETVLTIFPTVDPSVKSAPDGYLAVIWLANGKLWKAGLSGWNMVNDSQSAFLKDFYTAISCSFTN